MADVPSSGAELPDPQRIATQQDLANELTLLRQKAGLTIRDVARRTGISHSTVGDYFAGSHLPAAATSERLRTILVALGENNPAAIEKWMEALARARRAPGKRPSSARAPYRGLASFQPEDAAWFFGREELTQLLVKHVASGDAAGLGPLVVVGPSGAGKSSLLCAGLIPALRSGGPPLSGVGGERQLLFTPGSSPLRAIAVRLAPSNAEACEAGLRADPENYRHLIDQFRPHGLAIVVDQFEEVFTACPRESERQAFVAVLCALSGPALVVLGLRADFYGHALRYPALARALQDRQVVVGPMTAEQLRRTIVEPARLARLDVEDGLVDLLQRDFAPSAGSSDISAAAHEAGALPLLSHALRATWELTRGSKLTVAAYRASGGIRDAIACTAETVFGALRPGEQDLARQLLLQLVQVTNDGTETRRRVPLADLPAATDDGLLDRFVAERLITVDTDGAQITHEALLGAWPRLRTWIDNDREGLRVRRRVTETAWAWHEAGRDSTGLLRGGQLAMAVDWAAHPPNRASLSELEREFLDEAIAHQEAERNAERRRTRRLRRLVAALTTLVLAIAVLTGYAFRLQGISEQQRDLAISREVAIEADQIRGSDVSLFMQLSLAAYRIDPTLEARSRLMDSAALIPETRLLGTTGVVQTVAVSPNGHVLAAGGTDNKVRLWRLADPAHPTPLGSPLTGFANTVYSAAFSPDGRTLAAAGGDKTIRLWNVADPAHPTPLGSPLTGFANTVYSVAFSPDGRTLAAGSADNTVGLWDITSPRHSREVARLTGPANYVQSVAFSPDGRTLAAGSADHTVRLWNVANPRHPAPLGRPLGGFADTVYSVAFSPDGHTLAAGSVDRTIRLWNVAAPAHPAALGGPLRGPTSWVNAVTFSPDGHTLAAGSSDNAVWLWDIASRRVIAKLPHPTPVTSLAFTRDGRTLSTGAADGTVRLWHLPGPILTGTAKGVNAVAFSADGNILAAGSSDDDVWLWDVHNLQRPRPLPTLTGPSKALLALAFSPAGRILAAGGEDGTVRLWDLSDPLRPRSLPKLTGPAGFVETTAFSPNGKILAAGANDHRVWLWNVADPNRPRFIAKLPSLPNYVFSVAFSPNGRVLAVGDADDTIRLFNVTSPAHATPLGRPITGPTNYVYSVAFSPDGRTLAAGGADKTVRLWDVTRPNHPVSLGPPLAGSHSYVYAIAFSPNGRMLATGNTDDTGWLWDVADPRHPHAVATLSGPADYVYGVAFDKSGSTLALGSADHTVRLFDTDPARAASYICSIVGAPITRAEWTQYIPNVPYSPPCQ